jgi:hypothetical protein
MAANVKDGTDRSSNRSRNQLWRARRRRGESHIMRANLIGLNRLIVTFNPDLLLRHGKPGFLPSNAILAERRRLGKEPQACA